MTFSVSDYVAMDCFIPKLGETFRIHSRIPRAFVISANLYVAFGRWGWLGLGVWFNSAQICK